MNIYTKSLLYASTTFLASTIVSVTFAAENDDVAPAPPSIGADIPLTYFGPAPADVQKELIGPFQLLKSGKIDLEEGTIELPLYKGRLKDDSRLVWYIVTDTTDKFNADGLGINHSPKLAYADVGNAMRKATLTNDENMV